MSKDLVNHPDHYAFYKTTYEPCDATERLPHPFASAVEYILRSPLKGTELLDLRKALWWITRLDGNDNAYMGIRNVLLDAASAAPLAAMCSNHSLLNQWWFAVHINELSCDTIRDAIADLRKELLMYIADLESKSKEHEDD